MRVGGMKVHRVLHVALLAASLLTAACAANENKPVAPEEAGAALFGAYCASCHGIGAKGDGPAAMTMVPRPADLTSIEKRNQGRFDAEQISAYIDGRSWIQSHGSSLMPVWGRPMDDRNEAIMSTETLLTPVAIHQIVEYLRTLQVHEAVPQQEQEPPRS